MSTPGLSALLAELEAAARDVQTSQYAQGDDPYLTLAVLAEFVPAMS